MPDDNVTQTQQTADLAGYPSSDELAKAYRASSVEGQRQKARADQETQARVALEQQLAQYRQQVPQRGDPAQRLAEYGVPVEALEEFVTSRFTAAFEPIAKGALARNSLLTSYPDYQKYEADVAQFVNGDPALSQKYQRLFATDPEAAMEYAFLRFGENKRTTAGQTANGPTPQQAARSEAQIPSNRTGDARNQTGAQDDLLARTWEHYQKTGNPTAFAKARLRQTISDEFLNK